MNPWIVGFSAFGAAWLALCVWTVRRLLFRADRAARRVVLGWGVPVWLAVSGSQWFVRANRSISAPGELFAPGALLSLGTALFIGFPLFLWGGHFMGVFMARTSQPPPVRRPGRGEG